MAYKNPETKRVYQRAYYEAHREERITKREEYNAYQRAWKRARRASHPDEAKAYKRAWYAAHSEEAKALTRAKRAADLGKAREKDRERSAKRKAKDPAPLAYTRHKSAAKIRNVPFLLTFEEWQMVWNESGKAAERGRLSANYCMARFGDQGAYKIGNVRICTNRENAIERNAARRGKPGKPHSEATRKKLSMLAKARHVRGTISV